MKKKKPVWRKMLELLIFLLIAIMNLMPIVWGGLTSFKGRRDLFSYPPKFYGFTPVFDNYKVIIEGGFGQTIINSVLYSLFSIVIGLLLGMLAAYALERCEFRGKRLVFYLVIGGIPLSIGSAALLIPNYIYMSFIGMIDKVYTLPILYAAYNIPMAIWIMKGGLENVPVEIEEAAAIDGCSRLYIIFRLVPQMNRTAMASAALFIFIGAWNEFVVASVMINTSGLRTVQQSIYNYMGFFGLDWGLLTASTTLAVIPTLLIFCFLGKYMVSGVTAGSVKG